jgi:hypothetical protein
MQEASISQQVFVFSVHGNGRYGHRLLPSLTASTDIA